MVKAQKDRMVRDMAIMQTAQAYYANNSDKRIKLEQLMKDKFKGDQKALLWIQESVRAERRHGRVHRVRTSTVGRKG